MIWVVHLEKNLVFQELNGTIGDTKTQACNFGRVAFSGR
jgi:hypothetical protein